MLYLCSSYLCYRILHPRCESFFCRYYNIVLYHHGLKPTNIWIWLKRLQKDSNQSDKKLYKSGPTTLSWQIDPFTCSLSCFLIHSALTHTHTLTHTLPSFTYGACSPFKVAFTEHCADNDLGREGERDTDLQRPSHHKTRGKRIKLRLYSNSKDFNTLFLPTPLSPISPLVFFNWQKLIFRM